MEQLNQKIMRNRCLLHPKLHNCALSQFFYVSKYTREALCCIPSLGFELEALFILQNHDTPWFFRGFALQNHGFPWICLDSPVKHFTVPPTRLPQELVDLFDGCVTLICNYRSFGDRSSAGLSSVHLCWAVCEECR